MGFTRPHYVKSAYSKLFHRKYFYDSEPGIIARVVCFRTAGIFVENTVSPKKKLFSLPQFFCLMYFFSAPAYCDVFFFLLLFTE